MQVKNTNKKYSSSKKRNIWELYRKKINFNIKQKKISKKFDTVEISEEARELYEESIK